VNDESWNENQKKSKTERNMDRVRWSMINRSQTKEDIGTGVCGGTCTYFWVKGNNCTEDKFLDG
jgi:hypothetical protein